MSTQLTIDETDFWVEHTHIDDWLDTPENKVNHPDLHAWFEAKRLPAVEYYGGYPGRPYLHESGMTFSKWADACVVTCTYNGQRYRCVGASRLGDVWLTRKMDATVGYEVRPYINDCTDWHIQLPDGGSDA